MIPCEERLGEETYRSKVIEDWLDHNGHMNLGCYVMLFEEATDALFRQIGIGAIAVKDHGDSVFTLEAHTTYHKELTLDQEFYCETRLLGYDHNKVHYHHWMFDAENGELCATNELLSICVNLATRKSTNFRRNAIGNLEEIVLRHKRYPNQPAAIGRAIRQIGFPAQ
jgi:YbgC/YbaW family acyl-CoA thioester hydrolase